ncbi:MAG: peptidoglycan-binding protein [Acidobacteriota bacterium]|nr:peptidoglycan-binding protein [Acidobacteriota bacterium]
MKKTILLTLLCLLFTLAVSAQTTSDNKAKAAKETKTQRVIFRATKEQVVQVQTMLKEKGKYSGEFDGKFTEEFRDAIKDFQSENGLKPTGTLNRATLEKMGITLTEKQLETPVSPNSFAGAENDDKAKQPRKKAFRPVKDQITEAQTKLKNTGMYKGETDGRYTDDFRDSLKNYQEANALDKTGKLDEETLAKMGIELTDNQKGIETADSSKSTRTSFRPTKEQITEAQTKLKTAGLYTGEADGSYSNDLRAAIRNYQTANGLRRAGSLNRITLEKMEIKLSESQMEIPVNPNDLASEKSNSNNADKPKRTIFRATTDQIMEVQKMLKEKGLYNGDDTGKLNPATRSAIREWQAQNNVNKTGTLNKETLEAMKIELTDKQKEM